MLPLLLALNFDFRRPLADSDGSLTFPHPVFFTLPERLVELHSFGLRGTKALFKM